MCCVHLQQGFKVGAANAANEMEKGSQIDETGI